MIKSAASRLLSKFPCSMASWVKFFFHSLGGFGKCPQKLIWFLTEKCNLRCSHCFVHHANRKFRTEMSPDEILRIFETAGDNIRNIQFTGGEPLIYYGFEEVFSRIASHKSLQFLGVSTNGMQFEKLLSILGRLPITDTTYFFQTSIDGPEEIHNSVRGNNQAFQRTMEFIGNVKKLQEKRDRKLVLETVVTLSSLNIDHFESTLAIFRELKLPLVLNFVRSNHKSRLEPWKRNNFNPVDQMPLTIEQMQRAIGCWFKAFSDFFPKYFLEMHKIRMDNIIRFKTSGEWLYPCTTGISEAVIFSDGAVSICETRNPIGSLFDFDLNYRSFWKNHRPKRYKTCFCEYDCAMISSIQGSFLGQNLLCQRIGSSI